MQHTHLHTYILHRHSTYKEIHFIPLGSFQLQQLHAGLVYTYIHTCMHTTQTLDIQGNPLYPSGELSAMLDWCIHTYIHTYIHTTQTLDIQGNPLYPSGELPAAAFACWTGVEESRPDPLKPSTMTMYYTGICVYKLWYFAHVFMYMFMQCVCYSGTLCICLCLLRGIKT
jgi:hypothetical protein